MNPDDHLIDIPLGKFSFLSCPTEARKPYHRDALGRLCTIHITKSFRMAKVPVNRAFWFEIMQTTPWKRHLSDKSHRPAPDNDLAPVIGASWYDSIEFCRRLSVLWKRNIQLPTEAQWDYVCKAGSTTLFPWGLNRDGEDSYEEARKYALFSPAIGPKPALTPAGERLPNAWGIFDMIGLVSEWVRDSYHVDERNQIDNSQLQEEMYDPIFNGGEWRVLKGGAWCLGLRSACDLSRPTRTPDTEEFLNGLRIVEELS